MLDLLRQIMELGLHFNFNYYSELLVFCSDRSVKIKEHNSQTLSFDLVMDKGTGEHTFYAVTNLQALTIICNTLMEKRV